MIIHTLEDCGRYITTLQFDNKVASGIASSLKESQVKAFAKFLNENYSHKQVAISSDILINRRKQRKHKNK